MIPNNSIGMHNGLLPQIKSIACIFFIISQKSNRYPRSIDLGAIDILPLGRFLAACLRYFVSSRKKHH